jgi:hypothetical protein
MPAWTPKRSTRSARCSPTCARGPSSSGGAFDHDRKALRLNEVNAVLENPAGWNEPKRAQELGKEKKALDGDLDAFIAASLEQGVWPPIDRGGERGGGGGGEGGVADSAAGAGCTTPRRA